MINRFYALWYLTQATFVAIAQTNLSDNVVSPDILPDHRVVFRIRAPKASEVSLLGDWMDPAKPQPLTQDEHGLWSVTAGPLEPGIGIYNFSVDGVAIPDPVNPRLKIRARTSTSLVDVPGNPPELWQARDVPHGKIEINWEKSDVLGDTRAFYVYTPPGYLSVPEQRYGLAKGYPVLYLLHGNNDTAAGWTDVGKANFILDNLIAEKKAVPMIIVMPWGHAVPYGGPQTNNTAMFEKYLLEEVIRRVERKYRVAPGRANRAIVGLSMGGGHSLQIGLNHLDQFSAVGVFSAAVPNNFENRFKTLLDDPNETNAKLKLLWIGCGKEDSLFERNRNFAELLTAHNIHHTFHPTEGRHNYAVWRKYLAEVAPLLFRDGPAEP